MRSVYGIAIDTTSLTREQIMEKFMVSLEDLQQKVDENSKDNQVLVEENRSLREEFKQKILQYQEQIQLSKEMITKLQEMNVADHMLRYS